MKGENTLFLNDFEFYSADKQMTVSKPLVSAIITTHNRANLLPRAIDSVIIQSYPNVELIVVDDGSTDETPEILQKYEGQFPLFSTGKGSEVAQNQRSFRHIQNDTSLGAPAARNKGIQIANGKFIAGLDDDDEWHEDRIAELVAAYANKFSCITSDVKMIYPKSEAAWKKKNVIDLDTLLFTNQVGNQVLVLRDRLVEVGGFDEELSAAQDYDLWIRLCAEFGPVKNVQKPLQNVYMNHAEERISHRSWRGYFQFYKKHKHRMNVPQRKYQLYKVRRAQGKRENFREFLNSVPRGRLIKEVKRMISQKIQR